MTSFLTGGLAGIGSQGPPTKTAAALREINSRNVSYANKDFVKNIAWLNQSVDTLSAYTQKLEAGVTQANMNALEQIQGIFGDLFILFAGLEPTGIEVGDLKYVLQGIGAFFGINPDTPFPLNLLEAGKHILESFLVPLPQFTDVIFDAIMAWAEDFGLSPELIESLQALKDAIEALGSSFDGLFEAIGELLGAFGLLDFTSNSGIGAIWEALMDFIGGIGNIEALKPVLSLLSTLGVPFINALTAIINGGSSFLGFISGDQVRELGDNVVPTVSSDTTVWSVGGSATTGWMYDPATNAPGSSAGSFTSFGTGVAKNVLTQSFTKATPGSKLMVNAKVRWQGVPSAANDFGVMIVFYNGATAVDTQFVNIHAGHGINGAFTALPATEIEVPANVDGFKVGPRIGTGVTTGQVWIDDISVQRSGTLPMGIVDGLLGALENLIPISLFEDLLGGNVNSDSLASFFSGLLGADSPLNALNLFNIGNLFGSLPISHLTSDSIELLDNPGFREAISIQGGGIWTWDETKGRNVPGSAKVTANGSLRQLVSNLVKVTPGDKIDVSVWVTWAGLAYTGTSPIKLQVVRQWYDPVTESYATMGVYDAASFTNPVATQSSWTQLLKTEYEIPVDTSHIALQLIVAPNATAGDVNFDDASVKKTGKLKTSWIPGLDLLIAMVEQLFDIIGGIIPDNPVNEAVENFRDWVFGIGENFNNVGNNHNNLIDLVWGGFKQITGVGKSVGDLANAASDTASQADTSMQVGEWNNAILSLRNNKSLMEGVDETEEANFTTESLFITSTPAAVFTATSASVPVAYKRFAEDAKKGFITWFGKDAPADLRIDIYRANYETNTWEHIHTSPNLQGLVDATWRYLQYNITDVLDRIDVYSGIVLGVAWRVVGAGSHSIAGIPENKPAHPTIHPRRVVSVRTGVGNLAFGSTSYTPTVQPWFGIGIITGDTPEPYYAPRKFDWTTPGDYVFTIPPEFRKQGNLIDRVVIGGGKGGSGSFTWVTGNGAQGSEWHKDTLVYGVDIPMGTTQLTVRVGNRGEGGTGTVAEEGGNGAPSWIEGVGVPRITGPGGTVRRGDTGKGLSPGNLSWKGKLYVGGAEVGIGEVGNGPGGGGGGGLPYLAGKAGGHGGAFITVRQP